MNVGDVRGEQVYCEWAARPRRLLQRGGPDMITTSRVFTARPFSYCRALGRLYGTSSANRPARAVLIDRAALRRRVTGQA